MTADAPLLPPKPEAPLPGDCCGGGCARCVLDTYTEELARWEREVAEIRARTLGSEVVYDPN